MAGKEWRAVFCQRKIKRSNSYGYLHPYEKAQLPPVEGDRGSGKICIPTVFCTASEKTHVYCVTPWHLRRRCMCQYGAAVFFCSTQRASLVESCGVLPAVLFCCVSFMLTSCSSDSFDLFFGTSGKFMKGAVWLTATFSSSDR